MMLFLLACTSLSFNGWNASPKLTSAPTLTLTGTEYFSYFGGGAAGVGDLNGDGYDDLAVGAYQGAGFAGSAYIYYGSASGPSLAVSLAAPDPNGFYFGRACAGGDLNGDGYSDLVIAAPTAGSGYEGFVYVFYGSSTGISTTPDLSISGTASQQLGWSLATGDINGDGYDDIAVGAPYDTAYGYTAVYEGTSNGLDTSPAMSVRGTQAALGYDVALGDLDNDGIAELVIEESGYNGATGQVQVLQSSTGNWVVINGTQGGAQFGDNIEITGDMNGDGYNDLAVSSTYGRTLNGQMDIFLGGSNISTTSAATVNGVAGALASHLGSPGDIDGDGKADVLFGGSSYDNGRGTAEVWSGARGGLASSATLNLYGTAASDGFGSVVGGAGDLNGDGLLDYFVTAPFGASGYGEVQIFTGDPLSLDTGDTATDTAVDTATDTNSDTAVDTADSTPDTAVDTADSTPDTAIDDTADSTPDTAIDDTAIDTSTHDSTGDSSPTDDSQPVADDSQPVTDTGKTEEGCGGCQSSGGTLSTMMVLAAGLALSQRRRA